MSASACVRRRYLLLELEEKLFSLDGGNWREERPIFIPEEALLPFPKHPNMKISFENKSSGEISGHRPAKKRVHPTYEVSARKIPA